MKKTLTNEVIDLFEALAPSDEEIIHELCGPRVLSPGLGSEHASLHEPTASEALVQHARTGIYKLLLSLTQVPAPLGMAGAAAAHVALPTRTGPPPETVAMRWQQDDETYELYYLEPNRNRAYIRSLRLPAASLQLTELLIIDRKFPVKQAGDRAYVRWPLTALVDWVNSRAAAVMTDDKGLLWVS